MTISAAIFFLCLALVVLAICWSAVSDFRAYVIPNWTSLLIAGAFLVAAIATPHVALVGGLIAGAGVFVLGLILFALGWMGGGDVKLFAALALWCGPARLGPFTIVVCLAGACVALLMLSPLRRLAPTPSAEAAEATAQPMPYGVAIAIGGVWLVGQYAALLV